MLVLIRRLGESLKIGQNITVKVVQIRGNLVGLSVEAPTDIAMGHQKTVRRLASEGHRDGKGETWILIRRVSETFKIGDDILVMVLRANANQVGLAIEAPMDMPIHREEIFRQLVRENAGKVVSFASR